jgi:hypothetical protein
MVNSNKETPVLYDKCAEHIENLIPELQETVTEMKRTNEIYRKIFIPDEQLHTITIPREWYGQAIEIIAFPVGKVAEVEEEVLVAKRKKLDESLDQHLIDLKDFKFNRDAANDYD